MSTPPASQLSPLHWLLTGGTGPPPEKTNYLRMASDRKAVYREAKAYKAARKAATAEFREKWPSPCMRERPRRGEVMRLYGPCGTARGRAWGEQGGDEGVRNEGGSDKACAGTGANGDDDGAGAGANANAGGDGNDGTDGNGGKDEGHKDTDKGNVNE
ncbi:hypothetical protein GGS21DRAFT_222250 [Xylaria nigripes]|nr:hypothetical protein GGS21DRAFT_222250 [Xylaria nigripes]